MAEWDLTMRMGQYLDRHLVVPLLEFLDGKEIYNEKELLCGKLDLLKNTKMLDYVMDVHQKLFPDVAIPQDLHDRRATVVTELKRIKTESDPITSIFIDEEFTSLIKSSRDSRQLVDHLVKHTNFTMDMMDTVYHFAKIQYDCGKYAGAAEYLYFYGLLVPSTDKNFLSGLWGKLASEILMQNWDTALNDLNRLKEYIDNNPFGSALQSLQQRTWLIHWGLFVFFNHPKGQDLIIEMFLFQQQYLNTIQTICPHILRYLATAVITNKQRRPVMKELVKVIQQESYTYKDPITEFVECLYVKFDFDGAQQKLRECRTVLVNDFFLCACIDDFIDNARLFIFETFCRIHECISINMLAEKLNMTPEDAERWIVNLIRNARLDAKIDSKLGHVVMGAQAVSPYQQLIEKTKALFFRSQLLTANMEKRIALTMGERNHWPAQDF